VKVVVMLVAIFRIIRFSLSLSLSLYVYMYAQPLRCTDA